MLIGLTGQYCAGKNHVAKILEARGWEVLDVDKLGHQAIEEGKEAIVDRFGSSVLRGDGSVDRQALGSLVFGKDDELAALEEIVHPAANRLTERWIAERTGRKLVINAALLHRSDAFPRLSAILMVTAPYLTRLLRAKKRDRLPFRVLIERFRSQKNFAAQYRGINADIYIVQNKGSFGPCSAIRSRALERRIDSILTQIGMDR